ncbi:uncharacterized protein LOC142785203 [Rhipicephalus microplus]|uniref:uncharacterized protein LOC142785203 n=1 Tax=Rhipicephalus microplus TaxID=6941 RepID=UPI003F6B0FF8
MRSKATPRVLMSARRSPNSKGFTIASAAPVNARAAKAPAVGQADAGSELPRYFLRSHARQLLQGQHLAEKRKLEARESSSGKRRRLESPFEQAKPAEDPEAASPGQRRSQGPPHGRPSSRWCGRRHCSPESSVQDSPSLPRRRRQDALPRRRRQDALPRRRRQDALSRRRREDALALRLWREELPRIQKRLAAVFGPGPSPGMLSSACSTIASVNARAAKAPAVGLSCSSGGEKSRGKRRRLESPPEQAKPAEDPEAAIPGQRRSQGPPHGTVALSEDSVPEIQDASR